MSDRITSISKLEKVIGTTPGPRDLKVIDHLDENALLWISESTCFFACIFDKQLGVFTTIGGGQPGFVSADAGYLNIPTDYCDHAEQLQAGRDWGSLFLVPTLNETLRVNGMIESVAEGIARIKVLECFLHCAKALMRSNFWLPTSMDEKAIDAKPFLAKTIFMLVASSDKDGHADISPKGDVAGKLLRDYGESVWYPERPGNRRVDGYRNILSQPRIEILALIPGDTTILRLSGSARLSTDKAIRQDFAVNDKMPVMATEIHSHVMAIEQSSALKRAQLWPAEAPPITLNGADIFKAHIKLSKMKGIGAQLAKKAIDIPGAFEKALEIDYKINQY